MVVKLIYQMAFYQQKGGESSTTGSHFLDLWPPCTHTHTHINIQLAYLSRALSTHCGGLPANASLAFSAPTIKWKVPPVSAGL